MMGKVHFVINFNSIPEDYRNLLLYQLSKFHGFESFLDSSFLLDDNDQECPFIFESEGLKFRETYDDIALCVGSGVTSFLVGEWRDLLNELISLRCLHMGSVLSPDGERVKFNITLDSLSKFISSINKPFVSNSTNPLEIGEYLMYDSEDGSPAVGTDYEFKYREKLFAEQVLYVINKNIEGKIRDYKSLEDYFISKYHTEFKNGNPDVFEGDSYDDEIFNVSTLFSTVKLCIKKNIKNIISYNFDTILDRLIADYNVRNLFGVNENVAVYVHGPQMSNPYILGDKKSVNIVNIYHVHGVLDNDIPIEPIIFSETSYLDFQNNILNWSNLQLINIMSHYNVLCIGFSGTDPNFRMLRHLLYQSKIDSIIGNIDVKNFYLMRSCGDEISNLCKFDDPSNTNQCHSSIVCIKTYLDMVTTYFKEQLGVDVIWSNGYLFTAKQINNLADS